MSRRILIALEVVLIGAVLAVVLFVLISPLGSATTATPTPAPESTTVTVTLRQASAEPLGPPLPPVEQSPTAVENPAPAAPEPAGCRPIAGLEPLADSQIISYYGNPYTADMGILGELSPQALVDRVTSHARLYDSLNGPRGVQPALHLVYATAQIDPGPDGLYLLYVDDETLREYIDLACRNGLLIFLDMQIGHSGVESELAKLLPYLEQPHVHAALDPEWAMPSGEVPGQSIGSLDAADVNAAQAILQTFLDQRDLPDKLLIVHQFTSDMLTRPELIEDYPRVKLVIDMDGFGPSDIKRVKYGWFAAPAEHSAIKLFFGQDPDLMSEQEVLELDPDVIIYQ